MVAIGKYNKLKVNRLVDFGAYLDGGAGVEILMPAKYIKDPLSQGDEVTVFVYTDSEDRLVATTETPYAVVGEFAFLRVAAVNSIGAFLDWGLTKELLVPFREQKSKMVQGGRYIVYVYLDDESKRVAASAKIEKYIGNVLPDYSAGDIVDILVYKHTDLGYACIVDNMHHGLLYENEVFRDIVLGEKFQAYVKCIRNDGKIDLTLNGKACDRTKTVADRILNAMQKGKITISDHSTPEEIKAAFQCSKKDFKKAVGYLLKHKRITLSADKKILFARN